MKLEKIAAAVIKSETNSFLIQKKRLRPDVKVVVVGASARGRSSAGVHLQELVAPIVETLVAVGGLLAVGSGVVLQPIDEQIPVLFQQQKLTQHHESLKKRRKIKS